MVKKEKNKGGRPTIFSQELATEICERIAQGNSLRTVCRADDMPHIATIFRWFTEHKEFSEQYVRATEERTDAQHEDLLELGDEAIELAQNVDFKASNAVVSAVKLKADNLKWSLAKMKPKKYGDKLDVTSDGKVLPTPIYNGASSGKK